MRIVNCKVLCHDDDLTDSINFGLNKSDPDYRNEYSIKEAKIDLERVEYIVQTDNKFSEVGLMSGHAFSVTGVTYEELISLWTVPLGVTLI
jgi:hypothetical protein